MSRPFCLTVVVPRRTLYCTRQRRYITSTAAQFATHPETRTKPHSKHALKPQYYVITSFSTLHAGSHADRSHTLSARGSLNENTHTHTRTTNNVNIALSVVVSGLCKLGRFIGWVFVALTD